MTNLESIEVIGMPGCPPVKDAVLDPEKVKVTGFALSSLGGDARGQRRRVTAVAGQALVHPM